MHDTCRHGNPRATCEECAAEAFHQQIVDNLIRLTDKEREELRREINRVELPPPPWERKQ